MILLKELYLNLQDQRQQVATREQWQQKEFTELKGKQWAQYKVRSSVLSLLQRCISGLKPDIEACSSHHSKFGDYPAFLKFL